MANNTEYKSPQIGMGEPVGEEAAKIRALWQRFAEFAKTRKFKIIAAVVVLIIGIIIALAVILQIPAKPKPPQTAPTPTPIVFPTEKPGSQLPPHSQEATKLQDVLEKTIYNNPDLAFPSFDWKITLQ